MTAPDVGTATDALEALVNQFTDPLSFYRELVQNSVDAGSAEIEVRLEYADGVMRIHVDDWGEGMNQEIIDSRLTRLFASRKDGDLSKIGKFGIGFVSIFAIEPDAVSVDTSRDGENWRVLFRRDRSFARIARDEPVEGTKITVLKTVSQEEFEDYVFRTEKVLTYWCRFVAAELVFQGEVLSRPFGLDSPCQVRHREEGIDVVAGYTSALEPRIGFFNSGLTLVERRDTELSPAATVLVESRHLEHTMARDDVRRDEEFRRVLEIARHLVESELPIALRRATHEAWARRDAASFSFLTRALAKEVGPRQSWRWRAVDLPHGGGRQDGDDWVAVPGRDPAPEGHLVSGPNIATLPPGPYEAIWKLAVDGDLRSTRGLVLDVWDAAGKRVLAKEELAPRHLQPRGQLTLARIPFDCPARASIELRTSWSGECAVRLRRVEIVATSESSADAGSFADFELFADVTGARRTLGEIADRAGRDRLLRTARPTELAKRVQDETHHLVVQVGDNDARLNVLEALGARRPPRVEERWVLPVPLPDPPAGWAALRTALVHLLRETGWKVSHVVLGRMDAGFAADWVAVTVAAPGAITPIDDAVTLARGLLAAKRAVVVNGEHPTVVELVRLAAAEPDVAAYLAAKLLHLRHELTPNLDAMLASQTQIRRWERSTS